MPLTPKQVVDTLGKLGRVVNERLLVDWRQRGLLPKLTTRRLGRGKGTLNLWDQPNIVDQAAFVADLGGLDTHKITLALWCCGFDVSQDKLRTAWLDRVDHLSRSVTKQGLRDVGSQSVGQSYFDTLEDKFHNLATIAQRQSVKDADNSFVNPYEFWQSTLLIIFAKVIPNDFEDEIHQINVAILDMCFRNKQFDVPEASFEVTRKHIWLIRDYINLFQIQKAISQASSSQLEQAKEIWTAICRFCELASPSQPDPEVGLTPSRQMRAIFGPIVLSCLLIALGSSGGKPLVMIFQSLAHYLDRFEIESKSGLWRAKGGFYEYADAITHEFRSQVVPLWNEFWVSMQIDGLPKSIKKSPTK